MERQNSAGESASVDSGNVSRRTYVKLMGASSVAGLTGAAGCISTSPDDGGGDNGNGSGNGSTNGSDGGGQATTIVPGTAPGFKPFEFNRGGELVGFDVDLLNAVVSNADGYTLGEWNTMEFSSLIPALRNDRIDVIAAALTINEERKQSIAFTNPYYDADQAVLVSDNADFSPSSIQDLEGHSVGSQEGTTGASVVESELVEPGLVEPSNFNTYGSYVLAVEDLVNGNIDAVVVDTPVANTFATSREVHVAFTYTTGEQYGFGVRKGNSDLRTALNDGLQQVKQNGTLQELKEEWNVAQKAGSGEERSLHGSLSRRR